MKGCQKETGKVIVIHLTPSGPWILGWKRVLKMAYKIIKKSEIHGLFTPNDFWKPRAQDKKNNKERKENDFCSYDMKFNFVENRIIRFLVFNDHEKRSDH